MPDVYGPYSMNKLQLGRESTAGTAVAATTVWRGPFAMLEDASERVIVEEQVGQLVQAERSYDTMYRGRLAMPSTELTFEQFPHILEAGVMTATPSGAGPYTRAYSYPYNNTVPTVKSYTIEAYNAAADDDCNEMEYSLVEEFTIEGQAQKSWMMSATWFGRQLTPTTATSLSTLVAVEEALVPKTLLYIDDTGGTIGTTQASGVFMGGSIKVATGLVPVPVGDGNLYYVTHKWTKPTINYSLIFELVKGASKSWVKDERAKQKAGTVRLVRLSASGSSNRSMVIDMACKHDKVNGYTNSDGNTTVQIDGHVVYSSPDAKVWSCTIINNVSALP